MKVLVTGANGMLGQDLCPILEDIGCFVYESDIDTLDVTNEEQISVAIATIKPDVVIHAAAYTNVDKAEEERDLALKVNEQGTANVAKACAKNDCVMVYLSTDYVFDGEKNAPYIPTDSVNPINYYGLTKLKGEEAVKKYCEKYYIVRTSWLYGHHGKNFVETMISLSDDKELNVVNDQVGCPTWTVELANGIIKLIGSQKEYGIFHICGGGQTSWYGFAKEIFEQIGAKAKLIECTTDEFKRPANRPKYSVMNNEKYCRDWKVALRDYLALRCD